MNYRLRYTEVGCCDALVKASDSHLPIDPPHHLHGRHGAAVSVVVQLEPRLDEPDGVGGRARYESRARSRADVDGSRVGRQQGGGVEELLGLRVGAEVDGPRGRHAHQVGPQALEESAGALALDDVPKALNDAHTLDARSTCHSTVRNGKDLSVTCCHGCKSSPLVRWQQGFTRDMATISGGYPRQVYSMDLETVGRLLPSLHYFQRTCYNSTCCAGGSASN